MPQVVAGGSEISLKGNSLHGRSNLRWAQKFTYMRKIISAVIGPMPRPMPVGMFDPMPRVTVTFDDKSTKELFLYFPDEITFTENEFIGLTEDQAMDLKVQKHLKYLQS